MAPAMLSRRVSLFFLALCFPLLLLPACGGRQSQIAESGAVVHEFGLPDLELTGGSELLEGAGNPLGEPCLKIDPSGTVGLPGAAEIPGWKDARYLVFDVLHDSDVTGTLRLFFTEREEQQYSLGSKIAVMPGLRTRVAFPLSALDAQTVFLPRTPGRLKAIIWGRGTDRQLLSGISIGLDSVVTGQSLYLGGVRLSREEPRDYGVSGPPMVDSLGQWAARQWPGKTSGVGELRRNLREALGQAGEPEYPEQWSRYGGWKELRFEASGFFRLAKTSERWWLVDPDGYAFFSAGVDGVGPHHAACPVEGIEPLFAWLPQAGGEYSDCWGRIWDRRSFFFAAANLVRAFGDSWREHWTAITRSRMVDWRFNTLGNWSDSRVIRSFGMPYVLPLSDFPATENFVFRDFPDVFDPSYLEAAREFASQLEDRKDDPLMIGYFLDNEPQWAFASISPAAGMLEKGDRSATRDEFVRWLRERYDGSADSLSTAWGRRFESFEQLGEGKIRRADNLSEASASDLDLFSEIMVEQYLAPVVAEVREVDPNHLNLGIRWGGLGSEYCGSTGRFCDVFTVNMYRMLPEVEQLREMSRRTDRPLLIGEFHFGATDRGLPSTGLRGVSSQTQRGVAYSAYVETAAAMPEVVGTHYFIWNDQPVLGRFDGENFNIGLVDVCNRPYFEMLEGVRRTNARI